MKGKHQSLRRWEKSTLQNVKWGRKTWKWKMFKEEVKVKSKKIHNCKKGCASKHAAMVSLLCMHNYLDMHSSNMPLQMHIPPHHMCMFVCLYVWMLLYVFLHFFWHFTANSFFMALSLLLDSCVLCLTMQISSHSHWLTYMTHICTHTRRVQKCANSVMNFIRLPTTRRS